MLGNSEKQLCCSSNKNLFMFFNASKTKYRDRCTKFSLAPDIFPLGISSNNYQTVTMQLIEKNQLGSCLNYILTVPPFFVVMALETAA